MIKADSTTRSGCTARRSPLDACQRELGDEHPDYGDSCYNYAEFLMEQAQLGESIRYFELAAYAYEWSYGADHDETLDALDRAKEVRRMQGQGQGGRRRRRNSRR